MKLSEHIYKLCGVEYGTNSTCYAVVCPDGMVLFDAGAGAQERAVMERTRRDWGIAALPVTHVFLTHAHFDHSGNAAWFRRHGAMILSSAAEAEAIAAAGPETLRHLTKTEIQPCAVDRPLTDGQTVRVGELCVECILIPGHSPGSMAYHVEIDGLSALFVGDLLTVDGATPDNDMLLSLPWQGGPGADNKAFAQSVGKLCSRHVDLIAPGHLAVFRGDCDGLLRKLHKMAQDAIA